ncbi:MAG: VRR-NUC domain-containing protein [Caulobacteraceae bacterium]|nr:VRR-NUC domain-containing protein [Caulobacteraceae bacterium]
MLRAYLPGEVWFTTSLSGVPLTPAIARAAKSAGMERGAPDISIVLPDGDTRYVELKAAGGVLTPEQRVLAAVLGDRFAVCRSWPEVRAVVGGWLQLHDLAWLTDAQSVRRQLPRRTA